MCALKCAQSFAVLDRILLGTLEFRETWPRCRITYAHIFIIFLIHETLPCVEDLCKYFLAQPVKNVIWLQKRWVTSHKRERAGAEGSGGRELLDVVHLSLMGVLGACWGIMVNNTQKRTPPCTFQATEYWRTFILEDVKHDELGSRKAH